MKKIYQWMLAGTLAVMTMLTPVNVSAAETAAAVQNAESTQSKASYTVSFHANKGKKVKTTRTLSYNDTYGKLPKTTRDGYVFKGWYTKKSGGKKVTAKTVFKGRKDKVLYAHWKKAVTDDTQASGTFVTAEASQTSGQEEQKAPETSAQASGQGEEKAQEASSQATGQGIEKTQETSAQASGQGAEKAQEASSQVTGQETEEKPQMPDEQQAADGQSQIPAIQTAFPIVGQALVNYLPNTKTDYKQNNYSGFLVLKNFKAKYLYCQFDYPRFIGSNGKNGGCTATADAMLASIYMDKPFSPNDEGWIYGKGATWTNSDVVEGTKAYSVTRQCQTVYDYLNEGKPALIRVVGHSVTAIGLRKGVDRATITPADILIADPADGKVKCANEMGYRVMKDANGWGIRVPKASLPAK